MWPDQLYASSRGSFFKPVKPPSADPDVAPLLTVSVACEWLPYIRGSLYQLLLQATWDTDQAGLELVQSRVFNLIDLFVECAAADLPFSCPYDFTVSDGGFVLADQGPGYTPTTEGIYVPGTGWQSAAQTWPDSSTHYNVDIVKSFSISATVNSVSVDFDWSPGDVPAGFYGIRVWARLGGTVQAFGGVIGSSLAVGANHFTLAVGAACDSVEVEIDNGQGSPPSVPGLTTITNVEVRGTGTVV